MPISQISTSIQPPTESFKLLANINDLSNQLGVISQKKITGRVTLKIQGQQWSLHFYLGQLIWAADLMHPIRRWYRQLAQHCPTLAIETVNIAENSPHHCNDAAVSRLVRQGKIRRKDGEAIVKGHIVEILFDIFQQCSQIYNRSVLQMSCRYLHPSEVNSPLTAIPVDQAWLQTNRDWQTWRQAGLANYSPNLAPWLCQVESLRQKLSPMAYQSLAALVDGHRTLRDLAVKSRQDLQLLTQSIIHQVHQGSIQLVTVEDLPFSLQSVATPPLRKVSRSLPISPSRALLKSSAPPQATHPLIAYIDDHTLHGKIMGHILAHLNYRFIHLQDPLQALMRLLEHKPDLIFLDLAMPIINGYELCTKIRSVSIFKDIPIIILSSNDSVVARLQAKNVGASDFLAKPIRLTNVQTILQRHIAQSRGNFETI